MIFFPLGSGCLHFACSLCLCLCTPEQAVAVAGGVVAGLLLLVLLGIAAYLFWKSKYLKASYEELTDPVNSILQEPEVAQSTLVPPQNARYKGPFSAGHHLPFGDRDVDALSAPSYSLGLSFLCQGWGISSRLKWIKASVGQALGKDNQPWESTDHWARDKESLLFHSSLPSSQRNTQKIKVNRMLVFKSPCQKIPKIKQFFNK